ncbi:MAG: hypothetical protein AAGB10_02065 [Pseudomonadota bacterium]
MKLVLHIGTEKTGTTAAQYWFHENTEVLRSQGIWYAQSLGLPNNRALSVIARPADAEEDGFHHFGLTSAEDHAAFCINTREAFKRDVATAREAGARVFLISSEHCHSRLPLQGMVDQVYRIVSDLFDQIEVVCFLRPQIDTGLSLASTGSRVGNYVDKLHLGHIKPENVFYDFQKLVTRWADAFGPKAITLVPFKLNPSPVRYFKAALGLSETVTYIPDRRMNQTLDYRLVALTNTLVGPGARGRPRSLPQMARRYYVDSLPCEEPLSISLSDAQRLHAAFEPMNQQIASEWPSITATDLTPNWDRYPEVGTFDKLETADISPFLQTIFSRFNADLAIQRARVLLLESREAEEREDFVAAAHAMDAALPQLQGAKTVEPVAEWAADQHHHYLNRRDTLLAQDAMRRAVKNLEASRAAEDEADLERAIGSMERAIADLEAARGATSVAEWADEQHFHYTARYKRLLALMADQSTDARAPTDPASHT